MRIVFVFDDLDTSSWHPIMDVRAREMARTWTEMGATLFQVPSSALRHRPDETLAEIEAFRPDVLTATTFNFLLLGSVNADRLMHLDVPTVTMWDDPLGVMMIYMSFDHKRWGEPQLSELPWETSSGWRLAWLEWRSRRARASAIVPPERDLAPATIRRHLSNPRLMHFAWDTGHADAVVELGMARREQIHWRPVPTFSPFLAAGDRASEIPQTTDVAFCGNVYLEQVRGWHMLREPSLRRALDGMVRRKMADLGRSNWELFQDELESISPRTRDRLGLYPSRRGFWEFYLHAIWGVMTTSPRVEIMKRIPRKVTLFGLFSEQSSRQLLREFPNLEFGGQLDQFNELPRQFAATKVNVCLANGLIQNGTPSKLIDCLASGGFALCDPKPDLVRLFGPKVEAIFCRNSNELNAKVEYYLARPRERREIVEALRVDIRKHCTVRAYYEDALAKVRDVARTSGTAAAA